MKYLRYVVLGLTGCVTATAPSRSSMDTQAPLSPETLGATVYVIDAPDYWLLDSHVRVPEQWGRKACLLGGKDVLTELFRLATRTSEECALREVHRDKVHDHGRVIMRLIQGYELTLESILTPDGLNLDYALSCKAALIDHGILTIPLGASLIWMISENHGTPQYVILHVASVEK